MRAFIATLAALILATSAPAEEVVLGLSADQVGITATFDGSDILIFGAVKRDAPAPTDGALGVVITVAGPEAPVTVRRKERVAGIWINTDAVEVDSAPSFYAVASSGPLYDTISHTEDLRHSVSLGEAIRIVGAPMSVADLNAFSDGLTRIREGQELYQLLENAVAVDEDTLFRTQISLPANLTEGAYPTTIYLTRGREVVDIYQTEIEVAKVGLERLLYRLAHDQPLAYGLLSLAIAIAAGWLASAAFQVLRR